jgi:hypothetical protein
MLESVAALFRSWSPVRERTMVAAPNVVTATFEVCGPGGLFAN